MVPQVDQTDGEYDYIAEGFHTVESIMRTQSVRGVAVLNVYLDKIVQKPKNLLVLIKRPAGHLLLRDSIDLAKASVVVSDA
jgi:hypothetical protein